MSASLQPVTNPVTPPEPGDTVSRLIAALDAHRAGDFQQAEASYAAILRDDPNHPTALRLLGLLMLTTGRADAAVPVLRAAVDADPSLLQAHLALGGALLELGNIQEAIAAWRAAVACAPGAAEAFCGLAMALLHDRRAVDALDAAIRATQAAPGLAEAWFAKGAAEHALRQHEAARKSLAHAASLDPDHARARLALGNTLADLDATEDAAAEIRAAIAADPTLPEAHASLGWVLTALGRPFEAVAACDAAIRHRPDFARAHWNRAVAHLLAGEYGPGWQGHEWRRRDPQFAGDFPALAGPQWQGEDLAGRTLLVWAEQGLGDAIQFTRYLPLLVARGARVVVACAPALHHLLGAMDGVTTVAPDALPSYDFWVFQMSLPLLFGTTIETIPGAGGYLAVPSVPCAEPGGKRRIGLAWAGNPAHANDRRRSLPTEVLAPFAALPGIAWTNLQRGAQGAELTLMHRMPAPPPNLADLTDTATRIAELDLVISADTAVAHLAGALGKPVWVMLPHAPDWRWLLERTDSPWYRSARLYRQKRPGDWQSVISEIASALA